MKQKVCVITGANSGIGKQAAIQFASAGYLVVMGCRNKARGELALQDILKTSGGSAVLLLVDMGVKTSVLAFAQQLRERFDTIDVLIHNAAVFDLAQKERQLTSEGLESVWMTNHIGPVLLTEQLLSLLQNSNDGRVLLIASKGLLAMPGLKVDLQDPEFARRRFSVTKAYYQSKLAQIMYGRWLAGKLAGTHVTVNSIRVPAVQVDLARQAGVSSFQKWLYGVKSKHALTPAQMAETYFYLGTSPAMQGKTGEYFDEHHESVSAGRYAEDPQNIAAVMQLTNRYLA